MTDIPEAEREAHECVSSNRLNLGRFLDEFQRSVRLFELLERGGGPPSVGVFGGEFVQFRMIAAKDGALNVYHFGCSLRALRAQLPTCPTLARQTDAKKLREATKSFQRDFPHIASVRHAIAHAGELYETPRSMRENEQKNDEVFDAGTSSSGGLLLGALYERTYSVGFAGPCFLGENGQHNYRQACSRIQSSC